MTLPYLVVGLDEDDVGLVTVNNQSLNAIFLMEFDLVLFILDLLCTQQPAPVGHPVGAWVQNTSQIKIRKVPKNLDLRCVFRGSSV